ncbi:MAG: TldD/PmbA family protein [Candidatus Thorarchaeota archaeon]
MVWKKELLLEKAKLVLQEAEKLGATQAEVKLCVADTALTRLANSIIDQNVAERRSSANIVLYYGKRKGSVDFEVFDNASLRAATEAAAKIAKVSPENPDFLSIPEPQEYSSKLKQSDLVSESTLNATPELRAEYATKAISESHNVDKRIRAVAGAISHSVSETVFANSLGIEAYLSATRAAINLTVMADEGNEEAAGWSQDIRNGFGDLQVEEVAKRAAQKAANGFGTKVLDAGEYEIILEPAALAGFVFLMCYYAFNARMYQDYTSFLRDRIGEKVFSDKFTMRDNPLDTRFASPQFFDAEGYPRAPLDLVDHGVVKSIAYDTITATKDGVKSTGHQMRFMGQSMPMAQHVLIDEGNSSLEEMIEETKRGILVTHFHYQNAVDPSKGVLTGLTRDGAWLVENGEVKYPLKTLRYTDAAPRFFGSIDLVGKYGYLRDSTSIVPSMKLPSFKITGSTKG